MAIARATAMNKYGSMMLVLLLIIVEVSATAAAEQSCNIPATELEQCVVDVVNSGLRIMQPKCCNRMAKEFGCGCVLREILKKYGYDPQKPFCPEGTACDKV
ncbi:hypothetical protein SEVIR_7G042400v4 [Setaria viridis]|uniref:Bifunctional inhibitor/plant lipid transfer protein/seed storage helical domain-containing protein n=1 Tax=Setaria viridis TaxID=4556 RepID=A0A4U6TNV3_SETVI|nr:hypothetical protein SEVIR_7G042400v2 [Setaria viridis]